VYKPSYALNASGPHLHDQRTGEILQARINWYHNVMQLVHDWYMIQVGPNDPRARHMQLEDSLMGKLIRFVSSHEIGHTLGLRHNFGASSCVPVEKLRDKKWVEENGFCPSIMDYARFNYVAQPEDNISEKGLMPRIGVYDEWAIEWGYKWLPHLKTEKESVEYMAKWATKRIAKDKRLWYGNEGVKSDARCQSEDIGDDAVKAGEYGIKNLKRVVAGLKEWTYQPAEDYTALRSLFRQTHEQFKRYLFHAANWIGATNVTPRKNDEEGVIFTFPSKQKQKEVVIFLHQQLFETPEWLINRELFTLAGMGTGYDIGAMQRDILQKLLSNGLLGQFEFSRMANPGDAYSTGELLTDLEAGIFKEIKQKKPIDEYRRTLQRIYVMQLLKVLDPNMEGVVDLSFRDFSILPWARRMDLHAIVKGHLKELVQMIDAAAPSYKDKLSKYHFADIKDKIKQALNIDKSEKDKSQQNAQALKPVSIDYMEWIREQSLYSNWKGCTLMTNE
jgi:hypothetical protein